MRLAFLSWIEVDREDGALKKIAQQIRHWIAAGHEARFFVLGPSEEMWEGARDIPYELHPSGGLAVRFRRARALFRSALDWKPDVAFFRMNAYYPAMGAFMEQVPTVVELNADDLVEQKATLPRYQYLYYQHGRRRLWAGVAGVISVTRELLERFPPGDRPATVVSNGIELDRFPRLPPAENERPRLIFLGSPRRKRHGVDQIVGLARQVPEWDFDLIGIAGQDLEGPLPANLQAHGFLPRERYERRMARADVAIGPLAVRRNSMEEACSLKVREYLAYGVPTIIGHRDVDFSPPPPFVLELPNTPDNVQRHLEEIRRFVASWKGRRVERRDVEHVDAGLKEEQRLDFFHRVLEASRGRPSGRTDGFPRTAP